MIRFARWLATVVVVAAAPLHAAITVEQTTSPGGISAWLVEEPSIPFAALELRFKGGSNLDLPGKRGATNLMTALLDEGAGTLDARAFTIRTESLAAQFSFDAQGDSLSVSAKFLTENRDDAIELLRLALIEPRFDAEAIERVRAQVISGIDSDATDPDAIVGAVRDRLTFGDHPYGTTAKGTIDSVTALTRDDLIEAHARVLTRDRLYVAAVGDLDAATLGNLLDRLLGTLPAAGPPMPSAVPYTLPGGLTVVDFDTPQSVLMFGQGGIPRTDPDFFAAFIVMQVLGGSGFNSRLMSEVREKRGLTYGIGAYLIDRDLSQSIVGQVSTVNARVADTVDVIRAEWARMAADGLTQAELDRAKTYLTGAYPLRFDGNERIANILVGMQQDGYDIDYITRRNSLIEAVTLDDVNRVARDLIRPDDLHFFVVGKPEGLGANN